jgi:hypothetical protein
VCRCWLVFIAFNCWSGARAGFARPRDQPEVNTTGGSWCQKDFLSSLGQAVYNSPGAEITRMHKKQGENMHLEHKWKEPSSEARREAKVKKQLSALAVDWWASSSLSSSRT